MNKKTKVIASFPCTGKTYAGEHNKNALDMESSIYLYDTKGYEHLTAEEFKGIPNRKRLDNGFENYANAIMEKYNSGEYEYIFIASNPEVIQTLIDNNIDVLFIKPIDSTQNRNEFEKRAKNRDNNQTWIDNVVKFLPSDPFNDYDKNKSHIQVLYLAEFYYLNDLIKNGII